MTAVLVGATGALGVWLIYTSSDPRRPARFRRPPALADLLTRAGLPEARGRDVLAAVGLMAMAGAAAGFVLFGGGAATLGGAALAAAVPVATLRARRSRQVEEARQAWPRMIEELRIQTGGLGKSIPQALLEVGRRGPEGMREAFRAAEREWLVSTDFACVVEVLKARLADPAADAVCETLLVAHEVGGGNLDRHLAALAEDRILELDGRRDALARQAGARFARRFVLIVPLGMAVAGLSIGDGRAAYAGPGGQLAVAAGLAAVVGCWVWAGRLMRLPEQERVFR